MAKARKKAHRSNPMIAYPKNWKPSDTVRWAATAPRSEIEEKLAMVRAEIEAPSSDDSMYFVQLMQDEFALNDALGARHPMRKPRPKPISGEIIVNPWHTRKVSKKKYRKKRVKNPALVTKRELGYFYEDGIRDFRGSALVGQDLSGMDLRDASFQDANLYNVNFAGADLRGVDFRGADLGATDFRGAKVDVNTRLEGTNLRESLGPPDYYEGDRRIAGEESLDDAQFMVEVHDSGYVVAPVPGSPFEGQVKPKVFKGVNALNEAYAHAKDLAATAATIQQTSDEDAEILRGFLRDEDDRADNPRRKTPEWKRLINRCQKLWEAYDKKPLKKNLLAFGKHIEKMEGSASARVKSEARKAKRAYNKEFKDRGWKKPASKKAKKKASRRRNPYVTHPKTGEKVWVEDKKVKKLPPGEVDPEQGLPYEYMMSHKGGDGRVAPRGGLMGIGKGRPWRREIIRETGPSPIRAIARARGKKNPRAGKAKFMREMQKVLDKFRDREKKLMEKEGIRYDDPLADVFLREEGDKIVLYYDGAGYDYLSISSPYQMKLREDIIEKADKLGWMADDLTHYSMGFWPA